MRRLALFISLALVLVACSGGDGDPTTTTGAGAAPDATTTTAAETTTTRAETTTTTVVETTTSTTTTTTVPEVLAFETDPTTPPGSFDSYTATMSISFDMGGAEIVVTADGIWTQDAFQCTMSSELGGFAVTESIVATPETLWYDQGYGYEESDLFSGSAADLLGSCPAAPLFWAEFSSEDMPPITGDTIDYNGREAIEADLTELMSALSGLGMTGVDEDMVDVMQMWIDQETNTIIGLYAELRMPAALMGGAADDPDSLMTMKFSLDDFNDETLRVELP